MSTPDKPPRRRIAGEAAPGPAPVSKKPIKEKRGKPVAWPAAKEPVAPVGKQGAVPTEGVPAKKATLRTLMAKGPKPPREKVARPPKSAWKWLAQLVALTIAALVFGGIVGVPGLLEVREQRAVVNPKPDPAVEAGKSAEVIFTFRYDKLDDHLSDSKALMTPKFQKDFEKIAPALTELAPQRQIVVQAESRNAAVLQCGNVCNTAKASVLVFVDQARVTGEDKTPTVFANRIVMHMVKKSDTWLVNDIDAL